MKYKPSKIEEAEALDRISKKNPINIISLGLGVGLSPIAPGTLGSILALPIYFVMAHTTKLHYWIMLLVLTLLGAICSHYTSRVMRVHDHPAIVIDEVVGLLITYSVMMFSGVSPYDWHWLLVGFVWFRFFDIVKPWPISAIDRKMDGGVGIMMDDIVAGALSAFMLWVTIQSSETIVHFVMQML